MTLLAPLLQGFFSERLARQRNVSPHTVAAYRDSFRLLFAFVHSETGKAPSKLALEDLDAARITASYRIWRTSATTASAPAMPASRPSTRSSTTHPGKPRSRPS